MKTKTFFVVIMVLLASVTYSKPDVNIVGNSYSGFTIANQLELSDGVIIQQVTFDPNNIATYIFNKGIFNQDLTMANTPGLQWPKNSGKFACFTAGICLAAKINGQLREAMASYMGEYAQGYVNGIGGPALRDNRFRVYRIQAGDNNQTNPDYAQWGNMVPFGAPYIDVNNNGQWDPNIDKPGIKNAQQVVFVCLTDGFPEEHTSAEGFGGGTLPMMAQVQLTAWAYNKVGLFDIQIFRWVVINKNSSAWDSTYTGIVVDPDLGWADDDYIGCDTIRNLGYCYNGDNNDNIAQSIYAYGLNPPAFGMKYLASPINYNVSPPDTLGLTSFVYFTNPGSGGPPCEKDPNGEPIGAYHMLQGLKKDRTPWYNPQTGFRTKFTYPGDPESGNGWTESSGSVTNCNMDSITASNIIAQNPVGDRRFIFSSGAGNFKMNPGDTQEIGLSQFVARGTNHLNSVTLLKLLGDVSQSLHNGGYVIGVEPISSKIPERFRLHQNYPNPFNPITNIKFDITKSSHVKLIIYDILGKEITTLINETLSAGSYEVNWDGSGYPSGVYFYKLVTLVPMADDFVDVKKMLLLK